MIETLIIYALWCFFGFYVLNHSDLFERPRAAILPHLPWWLAYSLSCAFCLTFWTTLTLLLCGLATFGLLFSAPPLVLLINLTFLKIKPTS